MMKMHWAPVVVAVVALVTAVVADVASLNMSCSGTATAYRLNRWENRGDLPQQPISGNSKLIPHFTWIVMTSSCYHHSR